MLPLPAHLIHIHLYVIPQHKPQTFLLFCPRQSHFFRLLGLYPLASSRRPFPIYHHAMPGPLQLRRRRPPSQQQRKRTSLPLPLRGGVHLLLLAAALSLLSTPIQAFLPATPSSPSHRPPLPSSSSISSTSALYSSTGSGWRGGPRPDDEPVDLSGDGGVMKRVIRPGFGYKQESPPPHAYCKIAFVMKTATGQVIADRMKEPMEFMLVRFVAVVGFVCWRECGCGTEGMEGGKRHGRGGR